MSRLSAGIAVVRRVGGRVELFLVHPGGPYWQNKDAHAWSIPKGELDDGGDDEPAAIESTARREFLEETGHPVPAGPLVALEEIRIGSSKRLRAFLVAGDLDASRITSNTFEMEWPPRSGRHQTFPEVDRAGWFELDEARTKLHKGQVPLVDVIEETIDGDDQLVTWRGDAG